MMQFSGIAEAMKSGNAKKVREFVQAALDSGAEAEAIVNGALVAGMAEVGVRFKNNEIFVPEVMIAARAMKAGLEVLQPILAEKQVASRGIVVIGTVKGDLHDIGKNLVAMMLEGAGFSVVDLGVDVSPEAFLAAAQKENADIVAMSALLTTTMPAMEATVEALNAAGLGGRVKTMIGGAPVTQAYADQIGATGYSADAASAVDLANALLA